MSRRLTREEVIEKFKSIHGDRYGYDRIEYENARKKVCITCFLHGDFWQVPFDHLRGLGCSKCSGKYKPTQEEAEQKVNDRCKEENCKLYEPFLYKNKKTKIHLICDKDNHKWKTSYENIVRVKTGCPRCIGRHKTKEEIEQIIYERCVEENCSLYKEFIYKTQKSKMSLICNKDNNEWDVSYEDFIYSKYGCPVCNQSKLEKEVVIFLEEKNITIERFINKKRFKWLINPITNYSLTLDFYLPEYNIAIECQGEQHFLDKIFWYKKPLTKIQERDRIKFELCEKNGLILFYYANNKEYIPENYYSKIYTNIEELHKKIIT